MTSLRPSSYGKKTMANTVTHAKTLCILRLGSSPRSTVDPMWGKTPAIGWQKALQLDFDSHHAFC